MFGAACGIESEIPAADSVFTLLMTSLLISLLLFDVEAFV